MRNKKIWKLLGVTGIMVMTAAAGVQAGTLALEGSDGKIVYYSYSLENSGEGSMEALVDGEESDSVILHVQEDPDNATVTEEASDESETGDGSYSLPGEAEAAAQDSASPGQEDPERVSEYAGFDIGQEDGSWTWKGTQIRCLLDDDGSFYSNSSQEAVENKLYVYVSRKADGTIQSAEVVDGRELLEKMALADGE